MSSPTVQLTTGTESAMRSLDKQMYDFHVNRATLEIAGQESPTPFSSVSISSVAAVHPRCNELSESESRLTTNSTDLSFLYHPNSSSAQPPTEPPRASSKAEVQTLARDQGRSGITPGTLLDFARKPQTHWDTSNATEVTGDSSRKHAVMDAMSMLSNGSSVDGPSHTLGTSETTRAKEQQNTSADSADVPVWMGKPDTSVMFPGNSTADDILKELGIPRSMPHKNVQPASKFESTIKAKSASQIHNTDVNPDTYKFESWNVSANFEPPKQDIPLGTSHAATGGNEQGKEPTVKSETRPFTLRQRETYSFETSDLAYRLRSSLRSDFLSKELRSPSESAGDSLDTTLAHNMGTRSIDNILKAHGLSDEIGSNKGLKEGSACLSIGSSLDCVPTNASQNNETSKSLMRMSEGAIQGNRTDLSTTSAAGGMNLPPSTDNYSGSSVNYTMKAAGHTVNSSKPTMSCSMEAKARSRSSKKWSMNLSQNNETTTSKPNNSEQDTVRKFGSPVDYKSDRDKSLGIVPSSTSTITKSSTLGRYDYGMSKHFSGDAGYGTSSPKYNFMDSHRYDSYGTRYSGMNFSTSRDNYLSKDTGTHSGNIGDISHGLGSHYDLINSLGSRTDVLGYSMHQERQRLKNIDNMISTTPFYSHAMDTTKPYSSSYLRTDPKISYEPTSISGRKLYSSPALAELYTRNSWTTGVGNQQGNHGFESNLTKSSSVPAYPSVNLQTAKQIGSSVDLPRPGTSGNLQYNNSSRGQKKAAKVKNEKKNKEFGFVILNKKSSPQQKKGLQKSKPSCPFVKDKSDKGKARGNKQPTSKFRFADEGGAGQDFNVSKAINLQSGYDFVKDLNRIWTQSVLRDFESSQSPSKQLSGKYQPYTPTAPKDRKSADNAESGKCFYSRDSAQLSARKSLSHWADYNKSTGSKSVNHSLNIVPTDAHLVKSYSSIEGQTWDKANRFHGLPAKEGRQSISTGRSHRTSSPIPKPILKSSKAALTRPQSAIPNNPSVKPNQLVRGYSPIGSYSYGHAISANKKSESKSKSKTSSKSAVSVQSKGRSR